jgi:hypothetical protein
VPDDAELDDLQAVKQANPAPWITLPELRRQRAAIHASRWGLGEGSWLPPGTVPAANAAARGISPRIT